jgi:hypothetical protein
MGIHTYPIDDLLQAFGATVSDLGGVAIVLPQLRQQRIRNSGLEVRVLALAQRLVAATP